MRQGTRRGHGAHGEPTCGAGEATRPDGFNKNFNIFQSHYLDFRYAALSNYISTLFVVTLP
jgi:hypothetical protein